MRLKQYIGPFKKDDTIEIQSQQNYKYIHIGIQIPHRQPIAYAEKKQLTYELTINSKTYRVNEKDILEFDDMNERAFTIIFNEDLPWGSIIDIMYEITGR